MTSGMTTVGKLVTEETAKDIVVDLQLDIVEGYNSGLRGAELAKHVGKNALINLGFNIGIGGNELRKATQKEISEAVLKLAEKTSLPENIIKSAIDTSLGKKVQEKS